MNVLTIRAKAVVPGIPGVTVRVSVNTVCPAPVGVESDGVILLSAARVGAAGKWH